MVTETRSGSQTAAFLSRALKTSRAGLTTALTTAAEETLLRERRDAAATRGAEARETTAAAFGMQLRNALAKLLACADAADAISLLLATRERRRARETVDRLAAALGPDTVRLGTPAPAAAG